MTSQIAADLNDEFQNHLRKRLENEEFQSLDIELRKQILVKSGSSVARVHAQQELITRPVKKAAEAALELATGKNLPLCVISGLKNPLKRVQIAALVG